MVEQGTHKPLDVGSNPTLATEIQARLMDEFCYLPNSKPRPGYGIIEWDSSFIDSSVIISRVNNSGVGERRGCATSDNGWGFMYQLVVLKGLDHE